MVKLYRRSGSLKLELPPVGRGHVSLLDIASPHSEFGNILSSRVRWLDRIHIPSRPRILSSRIPVSRIKNSKNSKRKVKRTADVGWWPFVSNGRARLSQWFSQASVLVFYWQTLSFKNNKIVIIYRIIVQLAQVFNLESARDNLGTPVS